MNWSLFLLNQLFKYAVTAQAGEQNFSYSWLLILISSIAWMEQEDYHSMLVVAEKVYKGVRYENLWWVMEPSKQHDCAVHFWVYWEAL